MLVEIGITNLAIIDTLRLEFGAGFNVLTGETGTGKSIIIDAMNLILGSRASAEMVRTGSERATVEGVFALEGELAATVEPLLREQGLWDDGGLLVVRREVSAEGRSVARVNGRTVSLGALAELGHHLVDIHGQGEHLSLMRVRRHIDLLDRYAGLGAQRERFGDLAAELATVRQTLRAIHEGERERARRIDLLTYQVEEIRNARLTPDEEETLRRERDLLANAEKRAELATGAFGLLLGTDQRRGAVDLLGTVVDDLTGLVALDDVVGEQVQVVEGALYQLEECARWLRSYRDDIEYDPSRLETIEERLDLIQRLKRKYGETVAQVIAYGEAAANELGDVERSEERAEELAMRERALLAEMAELGAGLTQARARAAESLAARVESQLDDLGMGQARFVVEIVQVAADDGVPMPGGSQAFDATGLDRVEFLIAANPGEDPRPLARTASGGETSRLMLALKTVLSEADPVPTLIFDEIDSGIGGRAGAVVGQRLATLARDHQVLCVTHLPQIAGLGSRHYRVTKEVSGGRTTSLVRALDPDERVEELAVMLGGESTAATRQSAAELLQRAASTAH